MNPWVMDPAYGAKQKSLCKTVYVDSERIPREAVWFMQYLIERIKYEQKFNTCTR